MGSDVSQRPSRFQAGRVFRSVRFKIILLLIVPLVSLSTLWAFAASITLGDGLNLRHVNAIQDHLGYPSGALGSALEQERRLSLVFLGSKADGDRAAMESGRLVTDRQAEQFRRLAVDQSTQKVISPQAREWTKEILQYLDNLPARRKAVDAAGVTRSQTFTRYTTIITTVNQLQASLATLSDPEVTKDAGTQVDLARAREVLSQEDALLSGALAAGRLNFAEHVQFTKLVGTQRSLYADLLPDLRPDDRTFYQRIISTPEFNRLQSLENRFTDHMPTAAPKPNAMGGMGGAATTTPVDKQITPETQTQWKTTISSVITRFRGLELSSTSAAADRAKPIANGIILRVVLAGALGLVAVIASLVLSLWVGRSVIRELTGLRRAALDLANERLPGVIRRLRRGEEVDVAAEAPPLSFSTREIDQVGQAFNAARRTAIQGAVEESALRRSISEVFLNLARRNQALLHRQLSLLDTMERRISEPDELDDLFRLDHLATRMRRHAEGLIILSGQAPGRGWRNPVPAVDVARAAAAEVEDYARVTVAAMPRVAIAGTAVADLIHLLAELIENATLYSPPDTTVQVAGQLVAHGFALEVEDRGLSMDPAALAQANEKLARPPDFDLSNSAQLGLFVVGRLAQRHSIQVTLRTSPYGGTTAIVLLPDGIVVRSGDQGELDSGRLAVTRRGEDALVPIGAIGPPSTYPSTYGNRNGDTGPIPLTPGGGDRPPLPQRRNDVVPPVYDAGAPPAPHQTGPFPAPSFDTGQPPYETGPADPYDTGATDLHGGGSRDGGYERNSYDTGSYDTGSYDTGSFGSGRQDPPPGRFGGDSGYGSTGPDSGQWPIPPAEKPGELPPLPRRHSSEPPAAVPPSDPLTDPLTDRRSVFEPVDGSSAAGPAAPAAPAAPAPSARQEAPASAPEGGNGKPSLPRRVRQANLAPQLRDEVEPVSDTASGERSPEELRTMLSSIQKGWLRGRSDSGETGTDHKEEDI
ncbi:nitrate- and nitrite sensing domain-containing protein [Actinoallomurus bryophytorum]|uniref:histidine kinase n=1 Tax=Actinoallomurus bryophytorum TaxID=1490222 RepID=A0A543CT25_9ACTN|nr:nitrate- and nitrite sensing domain-containing protein [Actinoallomurus bryophytorum]TQM00171.1 signal transduction histidine kinase [Actinoallomurus bryophytorum]